MEEYMKKASLLLAFCLLLLPIGAMADSIQWGIASGSLTSANLNTCPVSNPSGPSCGSNSSLSGIGIVTSYTGNPTDLGPAGVGTMTIATPFLYSTSGTPMTPTPNNSVWAITWTGGGSVQIDASATLAADLGVAVGTPVFTGNFVSGSLLSVLFNQNTPYEIAQTSFTGEVQGYYSSAFTAWADGNAGLSNVLVNGTLTLGNATKPFSNGVGIVDGSFITGNPTPEPATLSLLGAGLIGLLGLRRRRS
jgi:hypothetical protein